MADFVKMSDLVDKQFTVAKVGPFKWKAWDNANKKMLVSDKWEKGYSKKYAVETDKGLLDVSGAQLGTMLEGVSDFGKADVNGRSFSVKSNGKTGIEIRYYINPVWDKPAGDKVVDVNPDEVISFDALDY